MIHAKRSPNPTIQGVKEALEKCARAGYVTTVSVDNAGMCNEAHEIADKHGADRFIAFRIAGHRNGFNFDVPGHNYQDDPAHAADEYARALLEYLPPEHDNRTWVICWNEIDKNQLEYCSDVAYRMCQDNRIAHLRLLFFGFNAGEPEPHQLTEPKFRQLAQHLQTIPRMAGLAVHEYTFNWTQPMADFTPYLIGRCQNIVALYPGVTIGITEFGWGRDGQSVPSHEQATDDMRWAVPYYKGIGKEVRCLAVWYDSSQSLWGGIGGWLSSLVPTMADITAANIPYPKHDGGFVPPPNDDIRIDQAEKGESGRCISYNATAAIQRKIVQDGLAPYGSEYRSYGYACQGAETLTDPRATYIYRAKVGDWSNVTRFRYVTGDNGEIIIPGGPDIEPPPIEKPPPVGERLDILQALRGVHLQQFDKEYIRHGQSGTQTTMIQHLDQFNWLYVKGTNGEYERLGIQMYRGEEWIFRYEDTSEGPDRWYAQYAQAGSVNLGAAWFPRYPVIGQWYEIPKYVRHFLKSNCAPQNHGPVVDRLRLISKPYDRTYPIHNKTEKVITLEWAAGEQYDYSWTRGGNIGFRKPNEDFQFMQWLEGRQPLQYVKPHCYNVGW